MCVCVCVGSGGCCHTVAVVVIMVLVLPPRAPPPLRSVLVLCSPQVLLVALPQLAATCAVLHSHVAPRHVLHTP
jgi:hypothetical protein